MKLEVCSSTSTQNKNGVVPTLTLPYQPFWSIRRAVACARSGPVRFWTSGGKGCIPRAFVPISVALRRPPLPLPPSPPSTMRRNRMRRRRWRRWWRWRWRWVAVDYSAVVCCRPSRRRRLCSVKIYKRNYINIYINYITVQKYLSIFKRRSTNGHSYSGSQAGIRGSFRNVPIYMYKKKIK